MPVNRTFCCLQHFQQSSIIRYTWQRQHLLAMSETNASRFGFVNFAETWNGRLAMMGFVIGLGTELLTGQGILSQLGLG